MKLNTGIYILATSLGITAMGCQKFIDVNTNPNSATVTSPTLIFTNALNVYATSLARDANVLGNFWGGYWAHSTSYTTGAPEKTYNFTNGDFNYWGGIFDNLTDFQYVLDEADRVGQSYLKGPAKVMKALRYQELVDLYGNVPYADAFKGTAVFQPKYDPATTIYDSLIKILDEAVADLKAHNFPTPFPAGIFSIGSRRGTQEWIRFANTAKLRILMRQSLVASRQQYVRTELQKILTEGSGFIGAGEDVTSQPGYAKSSGKLNPYYLATGYNENDAPQTGQSLYRMSAFLVNDLKSHNDTMRLKYLAAVAESLQPANAPDFYLGNVVDYVGVPFGGEGEDYLASLTSGVGPARVILGRATEAQVIFTAAESFLLQAEAAQRFGLAGLGNPKDLYEQGIRQSFRLLGVPAQHADELIAGSASFAAAPDKVQAILYQKWVALANFNGLEAWSEFRRNDYPLIPLSVNSSQNGHRPVRLYYPQDEYSTNVNNVNAQGDIDVAESRLFWDIR
ncbi:SusD/RagB family nutrient-binding outer membrane lipoprotein [Paraflavitalea pollutisoli]|uniref:SusD/RagB family nutrient-binding outer membrane lipoprotein n=1 Tax=Paraflavitalea pollutisoli TaxID=3034143 RepID=UPI0023EC38A2|nr:SusD/RagB family nutrient-binding outer membrane lipoprotein [Paraflavitalea sp. H1-2-19X]